MRQVGERIAEQANATAHSMTKAENFAGRSPINKVLLSPLKTMLLREKIEGVVTIFSGLP